jgi:Zn finger protein HypA/HybF involved in hydrogenase expression
MSEFSCKTCDEVIEVTGELTRCPDCLAWVTRDEDFEDDTTLMVDLSA